MSVKRREYGQISVLDIGGGLNDRSAGELERALKDEVTRGTRRLLLNLSECKFMNSTVLGVIAGAAMALEAIGSEVRLCGLPRPMLGHPLDRLRLAGLHETETEAIAAFGPAQADD